MLDITHTYSKDVEPLEENIETLEKVFESNEVFSMEEIIISYKVKKKKIVHLLNISVQSISICII